MHKYPKCRIDFPHLYKYAKVVFPFESSDRMLGFSFLLMYEIIIKVQMVLPMKYVLFADLDLMKD